MATLRGIPLFRSLVAGASACTLILLQFASPAPTRAVESSTQPFICNVRILPPRVPRNIVRDEIENGHAGSYLYVPGKFTRNFGLRVRVSLPLVVSNRGLYYSDGISIADMHNRAFIGLELMRYVHLGYRNEIGLDWQRPQGRSTYRYRGTGLFVSDTPHVLAISARGGTIALSVDGRTICTAPQRAFFAQNVPLYYQVDTGVVRYGDHPAGLADNIMRKTDDEPGYRPYAVRCIEYGYGVTWRSQGDGRFIASGKFNATAKTFGFGPIEPRYSSYCKRHGM